MFESRWTLSWPGCGCNSCRNGIWRGRRGRGRRRRREQWRWSRTSTPAWGRWIFTKPRQVFHEFNDQQFYDILFLSEIDRKWKWFVQVLVLFIILIALWFFKVCNWYLSPRDFVNLCRYLIFDICHLQIMKTFDICHLEIMKNFADADLHARLGRCLQSENSARLPGHRWVGHSCHLHVHPSLHSSTGTIESSKAFSLEVWSAWFEILCSFPCALNLLPRRTTSGRSLRWKRVWRTLRPWSLGGWSRRRCAGEWSFFLVEDLHSQRWVFVRTEFSAGMFCIDPVVKAIFRGVPETCYLSDTWWQTESCRWNHLQKSLFWRIHLSRTRKTWHTSVLNKVGLRPPSTLVSPLCWSSC